MVDIMIRGYELACILWIGRARTLASISLHQYIYIYIYILLIIIYLSIPTTSSTMNCMDTTQYES